MNADFVPFELAVKLKEKGFDYPCIAHYDINKELKVVIREPIFWHSDVLSYTDAPTISQVLKWLREEKKIYIVIAVNPTLSTKDKIAYYYQVYSNCNGVTSDYYESEECYAQWEDCAIGSIKSVFKYLI